MATYRKRPDSGALRDVPAIDAIRAPCGKFLGCKWSQVQILSPRPAEGRSIVRETGRAAALVFPASGASHHRLTKPGDVAYRALVRAALRAIDSRPRGGAGRPRRVLRRRRNMAVRRRNLLAGGVLPRSALSDRPR